MKNTKVFSAVLAVTGIVLLIIGMNVKISFGLLIVYIVFSVLLGFAHYKKSKLKIPMILGGVCSALPNGMPDYKFYYFLGCTLIAYAVVEFIQSIVQKTHEQDALEIVSNRQWFTLATVMVLLGSTLTYIHVTADPPGYCREQQRYISDEEFIKTSIALLDWDMNLVVTLYPEGTKKKNKDVDFDPNKRSGWRVSSTDFYGDNLQNFFRRLLGWQEVFVTWNTRRYTPPYTSGDSYTRFRYSVCGDLLDSSVGLPAHGTTITTINYLETTNRK